MTVEILIEKLRKEYGKNGMYKVLENYYKNIDGDKTINILMGMIWGLESTNYITEAEAESLIVEIIKKS